MKKALLILLSGAILLTAFEYLSYSIDKNIENVMTQRIPRATVVIDAGHGGIDVGAIGVDMSQEKNINLSISLDLYDYLMVCGIKSVLTRTGDYELYNESEGRTKSDLYRRLDFVNSNQNPVLISIHQNHYESQEEWGSQVWYSLNTDKSKVIADRIQSAIKEFTQPDNQRKNKASDKSYYLLYKATAPSVMVECGFMSNPEENEKLQNSEYQKDIAYSIMCGICEEV